MSTSRIWSILALIVAALTTLATLLDAIAPKYAVWALAIAAGIAAFTERVQGGKSKVEGEGMNGGSYRRFGE